MDRHPHPFKRILFGFAFSPTLEINILETSRIAHFFNAKLILLHVGKKTGEKLEIVNTLLEKIDYPDDAIEVQWEEGKPVSVILEA